MNPIRKIFDFMAGYSAYRARQSAGAGGLAHASVELLNEEGIHTQHAANWTLADARDYIRNTSFAQTILNQLQVNCVGARGGDLSFATDDEDFNARVNLEWQRYSASCGFFDNSPLNRILKDLVGCYYFNGGDALIVFDDGQISGGFGTGKVLVFESDQIANAPAGWFAAHFPAGWTQSRGVIRDEYSRIRGYFASQRRGLDEFELGKGGEPQFLTFCDKSEEFDPLKRNFFFLARCWRPNQGRGISALTHVLNELRNLDDLGGAETAAAKLNAHIALAIEEDTSAADAMMVSQMMAGQTPTATRTRFDPMLRKQAQILQLGTGKKVTAFDTKRPNDRVPEYIDQLQSNIIATFGVGREFFKLSPESSYIAYRGAMLMAWQSIGSFQRELEAVCNWLCSQWFYWRRTARVNRLEVTPQILADIDRRCEWFFPAMPEVDEAATQNATNAKLQNTNTTLRKMHGADWRRIIDERARERAYCNEHGEVYPGDRLTSGGVVDNPTEGTEDGEE